jgi:hypothetical protein
MDDPTRREQAAPRADDAPKPPVIKLDDLAAKLDDLGKRLVLDEHLYWLVPEGWTETSLRELAAQVGIPLDIMAHRAVIAARGVMPGNRSPWGAGIPQFDFEAVTGRHARRRLNESANRLSQTDRLVVLKCQGRGCRRRLGQVVTRPSSGAATSDGTIEPDWTTEGPVLIIFGPVEPGSRPGEYRLRGRKESVTAPTRGITLRGHKVREDGTLDPSEVPLGPGERIAIVCGCGHENVVSLSALSSMAELARAALDAR